MMATTPTANTTGIFWMGRDSPKTVKGAGWRICLVLTCFILRNEQFVNDYIPECIMSLLATSDFRPYPAVNGLRDAAKQDDAACTFNRGMVRAVTAPVFRGCGSAGRSA